MSLAKTLAVVVPEKSNTGCRTCQWVDALQEADRRAFDAWLAGGHSSVQLWEICCAEPDHRLQISLTGFRHHIKHHKPL